MADLVQPSSVHLGTGMIGQCLCTSQFLLRRDSEVKVGGPVLQVGLIQPFALLEDFKVAGLDLFNQSWR